MTRHSSTAVQPERLRTYRPDIQGLRAVAIMMVVSMHCGILDIHGGVDVSFVLSGFLIGGQLLAEIDKTGKVSLTRFWARRFRRLTPPMALVIVGTAVLAWMYGSPLRFRAFMEDGLAASLSFLNWRLVENGTDYFANDGSQTPYQHFWSLGIEEQFYFAAPILLVALVWISRKIFRNRALVALFLTAVIAGSFYLGWSKTSENQPLAYFSTHTRIWEITCGVLLALAAPLVSRMNTAVAAIISWLGLGTVLVTAMLITSTTPLPGYAVAGPVIGAVMVIAGGCANPRFGAERLLDNPVLDFVGNVSYGWYLTHWPLLVLWPSITDRDFTFQERMRVVVLSFLVAVVLHYAVERRFKKNVSLVARPWKGVFTGGFTTAGTAGAMVLATIVPLHLATSSPSNTVAVGYTSEASVKDSVHRTQLSATVQGALQSAPKNIAEAGCIDNIDVPKFVMRDGCVAGDPKGSKTLVIMGDSHAWQWNDLYDEIGKELGVRVVTMEKGGCSPQAYRIINPQLNREYTECDSWRQSAFAELKKIRPDVLVIADRARGEANRAGAEASFKVFKGTGARLVYMTDTPEPGQNIPDCLASHMDTITLCNRKQWQALEYTEVRAMEQAVAKKYGADIIDTAPAFCAEGVCPAVIGDQVVYFDNSHITSSYSKTLKPFLQPTLKEILDRA
ncbi:acyltransferase family protein [Streptomyces sp. Ru72]|uniref:acyltransferase family protein n=1 Tax=Streptomyces sp. Ru72 TaxID=2080747 RepID=UPI000CDD04BD|nr:acyltransferase family protein [Streptomyces sp. Ru72]POX54679.1 acyltransferase [Streptomyces sp. Ru72]